MENVDTKETKVEENVEMVLNATGRIPNIKDLGLEKTDIKLNEDNSIAVDKYQNTSVSGIYAIGDVTN